MKVSNVGQFVAMDGCQSRPKNFVCIDETACPLTDEQIVFVKQHTDFHRFQNPQWFMTCSEPRYDNYPGLYQEKFK